MKPTLAFVDNIFHQYTMSADFFRELLSPHFEITNYWDKTSQKGPRVSVDEINKHDYVIFWQRINPINDLEKITAKMIWVPMYDSLNPDYLFWKNLSTLPIKIISFSEHIHKKCLQFKIESNYVKYWSKPTTNELPFEQRARTLFFWNRGAVAFSDIKRIIDPQSVDKIIILSRPDPNYKTEEITETDIEKYKIEIIKMDFTSSKDDYLRLVKKAGIFVAPRRKEGIGLSFIEAMSMGLLVLAYNDGTMNEYITHNENGYLFNDKQNKLQDFSNSMLLIDKVISDANSGYKKWLQDSEKLPEYIKSEIKRKKTQIKWLWRTAYTLKLWQFRIRSKYF